MFSKLGDGRSFDKFGISREDSPMDFSGAQKLWKDAPLNGKTFSSTISRLSMKRGAFSSIIHWLRCFSPDFYVLLIASINLKSPDRDRCNCQAQCHQSPFLSLYIPRVSPLSLHIPHTFPRIEIMPTGLDCLRRFTR